MTDYTNQDVIDRQNITPNAGCVIEGEFYDIRNLIHELATLRAENERLREAMVDMAMTLNKTAEYQVSELMSDNDRLREALRRIAEGNLGDEPWQASYEVIRHVAKEALK